MSWSIQARARPCSAIARPRPAGTITDLLLEGSKDISWFLQIHGTADARLVDNDCSDCWRALRRPVHRQHRLQHDLTFGGPVNTVSVVRNYGAAGLDYPIHVCMIPIQRHAFTGTEAVGATRSLFYSFRDKLQTLRHTYQMQWVPPTGVSMEGGA